MCIWMWWMSLFRYLCTLRGIFFCHMKSLHTSHFCCKNHSSSASRSMIFLPTVENQLQHVWLSHFLSFVVDLSRDTNPSLRRSENFFLFVEYHFLCSNHEHTEWKSPLTSEKSSKIWMISCYELICMAFFQMLSCKKAHLLVRLNEFLIFWRWFILLDSATSSDSVHIGPLKKILGLNFQRPIWNFVQNMNVKQFLVPLINILSSSEPRRWPTTWQHGGRRFPLGLWQHS